MQEQIELKGNFKIVNIDELVPNNWNPNEQTDFIFEKELESFKKFGFLDPVTVRSKDGKYEIIDGEHRWKAAKQLNMSEIIINDLGENFKTEDAAQLTVILNETRGSANYQKLSELIKQISQDVPLQALQLVMPYTDVELKSMLARTEIDWNSIQPGISNPSSKQDPPIDDAETYTIRLTEEDMASLREQLYRFKTILYPNFDPDEVADTEIWQAITYILRTTPDEQIKL